MSWAEIRPKIEGLDERLEYDGWPVPTEPDFWKWIYFDEALPIISDQLPKYTRGNPDSELVVAKSYLSVFDIAATGDENRIREVIQDETIYGRTSFEVILDGPLLSSLLDHMKIPRTRQALYLPEFKKENPTFTRRLKKADASLKAIAWWAFWGDVNHQHQRSQSEYVYASEPVLTTEQGVNFMVEKLKLNPPEIIQ